MIRCQQLATGSTTHCGALDIHDDYPGLTLSIKWNSQESPSSSYHNVKCIVDIHT